MGIDLKTKQVQGYSFLKDLQENSIGAEIWWDSSPTLLRSWIDQFTKQVNNKKESKQREEFLADFFDPIDPSKSLIQGVTTNPNLITNCVLLDKDLWKNDFRTIKKAEGITDSKILYWSLYKHVIATGAKIFKEMWVKSQGKYGWVCAQVDPRTTLNSDQIFMQGQELSALGPNIMVKVPGSVAGYDSIERLIACGISINNTFSYTVPQLTKCIDAIRRGLERANKNSVDISRWRCVITFMIGRFGRQGNLVEQAKKRSINLTTEDIRWAEIAIFKRFCEVLSISGVPAKILLSSIECDLNPNTGKASCWHIEKTLGSHTIYTFKPQLLESLCSLQKTMQKPNFSAHDEPVPAELMNQLMEIPYFNDSYSIDKICPNQFHHLDPFIATYAESYESVRKMTNFISNGTVI